MDTFEHKGQSLISTFDRTRFKECLVGIYR